VICGESLRSQEIQGFFQGKILKKNTYIKQLSIKIFTYEGICNAPLMICQTAVYWLILSEKSYVAIG
jgi:hypothetical protein